MLSFFLTLNRMLKAVYRSWREPAFRSTLILAVLILLSGTVFYRTAEGWSWIDAAYFSMMVATTVGLGDLAPSTPLSKVFTMLYAVTSIGVFIALVTQLATALITLREEKKDESDG
ncbi:MAG: transporter [Gammaproteobacteria bacterium]|nr:MAG: transporter [Gammaproteobacteria bacterium]